MKEKAKTISMLDVDSVLGEFYYEEEENAVKDVEERWSYTINLSTTLQTNFMVSEITL